MRGHRTDMGLGESVAKIEKLVDTAFRAFVASVQICVNLRNLCNLRQK
jgi:hypothetical protein